MAAAFVDMIGFAMIFPLGRRSAILFGLSMSAIAFVVFGFAVTIWMLFLSRLIQGIGGGTTGVLQAYVADVTQPKDRARALGWLSASTAAGVMIGPAIGSLAFNFGPAAPGLVAAGLCVLNIGFASRWLPESHPRKTGSGAVADSAPQEPLRSLGNMIVDFVRVPQGEVARLVWIYAVGMLGFMSMTAVLALYLESDFGITEKTIGIFFVYVGALGVVMRAVILGKLVDWLGETKVMRIGAMLLTMGLFAIPFPRSVISLGVVIALIPIGTACLFPSVTALVRGRTRARPDLRGAAGLRRRVAGHRAHLGHGGVPGSGPGGTVLYRRCCGGDCDRPRVQGATCRKNLGGG
jgi:MFS family permease